MTFALSSIDKGIGEKSAMNFLIDMDGDIKQFESHQKLIAMAGLDLALYQSEKTDRKGRSPSEATDISDGSFG